MSIERAIETLQAEVGAFHQGTAEQPAEGTEAWFLLRAKSLGLSYLKRVRQLSLHDNPASAERFFRDSSRVVKGDPEL